MEIDPAEQIVQKASSRLIAINKVSATGGSTIQKFYTNSAVFVTGGTGLLGKLLIEKLLRVCFVKKIFILIRPKRNMTPQQRLFEMFKDPVFETINLEQLDFLNRIVAIQGEISQERLGINDNEWNMLTNEVNFIYHIAANVKFDVELSEAVLNNVRGTREALLLGKACKELRAFVHVSTAYSHATRDRIGNSVLEQFYEAPTPPAALIQMAETMSKKRLNDLTPALTDGWPNTYTFTKALGEEIVRTMAGDLPICIVKPSIVTGTYSEPTPGWIDISCVYGASGLLLGGGMGVIKVCYSDNEILLSVVPADVVTNAIIAAGWETGNQKQNKKNDEIQIYTVSNIRNPLTWGELSRILYPNKWKTPSPHALWYVSVTYTKSFLLFSLLSWLFHYLPAYILDGIYLLLGKKRRFAKLSHKLKKLSVALSFFTLNEWKLVDDNLQALSQNMSETDKVLFDCDMANIDRDLHLSIWWVGLRKYIVKDGLKDTKKGMRRQIFFFFANFILLSACIYILWKLVSLSLFFTGSVFSSISM